MADNYLENRMDDLRNGRLSQKLARPGGSVLRKNYLQIPFPPRRVLVTGGANGIGRAIASAYIKAGCKVAVFDIDKSSGESIAHDMGVRFYHLDLCDTNAVSSAFENLLTAWRDLDILINNAGISEFHRLTDGESDNFDRIINTNLRPAYILARLWAIHRKAFPSTSDFGGRMINISSTRHIQSESGTECYSASKGGIASLTHALMMSLSEFNITVNCISPGWIHTGDASGLSNADKLQHPSHRVGEPEDIARLCIFLSSPGNDFINGADIPVDGGMTRKMIYLE